LNGAIHGYDTARNIAQIAPYRRRPRITLHQARYGIGPNDYGKPRKSGVSSNEFTAHRPAETLRQGLRGNLPVLTAQPSLSAYRPTPVSPTGPLSYSRPKGKTGADSSGCVIDASSGALPDD
jgi:hypothetical protein